MGSLAVGDAVKIAIKAAGPVNLIYSEPRDFEGTLNTTSDALSQEIALNASIELVADTTDSDADGMSDTFEPHWTGWDAKTKRLVVTGSEPRLYMLKLDEQTGAVAMDDAFRGADGSSGFSFDSREWPHGWTGTGSPHGVVFTR